MRNEEHMYERLPLFMPRDTKYREILKIVSGIHRVSQWNNNVELSVTGFVSDTGRGEEDEEIPLSSSPLPLPPTSPLHYHTQCCLSCVSPHSAPRNPNCFIYFSMTPERIEIRDSNASHIRNRNLIYIVRESQPNNRPDKQN